MRGLECARGKVPITNVGDVMVRFFIVLFFWLVPALSGLSKGVEAEIHRLVTFGMNMKEAVEDNANWRICGNYFAAKEFMGEKVIFFIYEKESSRHIVQALTFITVEHFIVSIDGEATVPEVIVVRDGQNTQFILKMGVEDYLAGLPCIAKGTKI